MGQGERERERDDKRGAKGAYESIIASPFLKYVRKGGRGREREREGERETIKREDMGVQDNTSTAPFLK